jgi:tRNA threonylcarbamoyladenosine biosynthesis protein TsaE
VAQATEKMYDIVTHSPEETMAFGRSLASLLHPPCVVLLDGELGSGKTTLIKGIVAGLGPASEDEVTSPSFTLVHEYGGREKAGTQSGTLYHVDLYRIDGRREVESLGLDELFNPWSTVLIEWGEKLPDRPPGPFFRVQLEIAGEFERRISVEKQIPELRKANKHD